MVDRHQQSTPSLAGTQEAEEPAACVGFPTIPVPGDQAHGPQGRPHSPPPASGTSAYLVLSLPLGHVRKDHLSSRVTCLDVFEKKVWVRGLERGSAWGALGWTPEHCRAWPTQERQWAGSAGGLLTIKAFAAFFFYSQPSLSTELRTIKKQKSFFSFRAMNNLEPEP